MARTTAVTVDAREPWNDSGIDLVEGDLVTVAAAGQWRDLHTVCGPEGYDARKLALFVPLRRSLSGRWFELIAAVGRRRPFFRIGAGAGFTAPASGRLHFFANDVRFMYGNNHGEIQVEVTVSRTGAAGADA